MSFEASAEERRAAGSAATGIFDLAPFRDPHGIVRRWHWWAILVMALGTRLAQLWIEPAYLHPDAIYQALEPAYHLVYGGGDLPWEYREGARSWLWPALLSVPLRACQLTSSCGPGVGMHVGVHVMRATGIGIDLLGALAAVRWILRMTRATESHGAAALVASVVLALHPAFVVMGAQPLVDVPAATLAVLACERAWLLSFPSLSIRLPPEGARRQEASSAVAWMHTVCLGALLTAMSLLRIQLAPLALGLLVFFLAHARRHKQQSRTLAPLFLSSLAVAALFMTADLVAWGSPIHSWQMYLSHHLRADGPSSALMPSDRYFRDLNLALPFLGPLALALALAGAASPRVSRHVSAPSTAATLPLVALMLVVMPHQLISLKVWRFMYPGQLLLVVSATIGAVTIAQLWMPGPRNQTQDRRSTHVPRRVLQGIALLATLAGISHAYARGSPWETTWLFDQAGWPAIERTRATTNAYLWLSAQPARGKIIQAALPAVAVPGRVFLGHAVPVVHATGRQPSRAELEGADTWILEADAGFPDSVERVWLSSDGSIQIVQSRSP